MTSRSQRGERSGGRAGDRIGGRRRARASGGGAAAQAPTPRCARRSSTTAGTRWPRPRPISPPPDPRARAGARGRLAVGRPARDPGAVPLRDAGRRWWPGTGSAPRFGRAVAELGDRQPGVWVVGGAVRDACSGAAHARSTWSSRGTRTALARSLADASAPARRRDPSFGTASVAAPGSSRPARVSICASARGETLPASPAALPVVEPGALGGPRGGATSRQRHRGRRPGERRPAGARGGPCASRTSWRVACACCTTGASATIDPPVAPRPLRRAPGFEPDERASAARRPCGARRRARQVTGARVGAELRLALARGRRPRALGEIDRLGLIAALHPRLRLERSVADAARDRCRREARPGSPPARGARPAARCCRPPVSPGPSCGAGSSGSSSPPPTASG